MFHSRRCFAVVELAALICASLLLAVLSVSSVRTSKAASRLTAQALRQSIGLSVQSLRRPANATTRESELERSDVESERSFRSFGASTDFASLQTWLSLQSKYRVIAPHAQPVDESPRVFIGNDAERARSPPGGNV